MDSGAAGLALVFYLAILVGWIALVLYVGKYIAEQKGRDPVEGIALGCVLGPLGWLIEALLPSREPVSTPVARPARSTSASSSPTEKAGKKTGKTYYAWQIMYVPGALVLEADDSREPKGPDGPPPGWLQFDEDASVASLIDAMAGAEVRYFRDRGYRVVEAVWRPGSRPTILAAYGDPARTYDLLWPDYPRVKWSSLVGQDGTWEPGASAEGVPELMVPVGAEAARSTQEPAEVEPRSPVAPAPTATVQERPTKTCPDCAETILAAARICRFCRYEFWPSAAASPAAEEVAQTNAGEPTTELEPTAPPPSAPPPLTATPSPPTYAPQPPPCLPPQGWPRGLPPGPAAPPPGRGPWVPPPSRPADQDRG